MKQISNKYILVYIAVNEKKNKEWRNINKQSKMEGEMKGASNFSNNTMKYGASSNFKASLRTGEKEIRLK